MFNIENFETSFPFAAKAMKANPQAQSAVTEFCDRYKLSAKDTLDVIEYVLRGRDSGKEKIEATREGFNRDALIALSVEQDAESQNMMTAFFPDLKKRGMRTTVYFWNF